MAIWAKTARQTWVPAQREGLLIHPWFKSSPWTLATDVLHLIPSTSPLNAPHAGSTGTSWAAEAGPFPGPPAHLSPCSPIPVTLNLNLLSGPACKAFQHSCANTAHGSINVESVAASNSLNKHPRSCWNLQATPSSHCSQFFRLLEAMGGEIVLVT